HRDHDEVFIVTQGMLRFTSATENVDVEAGACVTVPAGTAHTFSNPFDAPATFICTMTPDLYIEYFRDLGRLPVNEQGMLDPGDIGRGRRLVPKLPAVSGREAVAIFERTEFQVVRRRGSHIIMTRRGHADSKGRPERRRVPSLDGLRPGSPSSERWQSPSRPPYNFLPGVIRFRRT